MDGIKRLLETAMFFNVPYVVNVDYGRTLIWGPYRLLGTLDILYVVSQFSPFLVLLSIWRSLAMPV